MDKKLTIYLNNFSSDRIFVIGHMFMPPAGFVFQEEHADFTVYEKNYPRLIAEVLRHNGILRVPFSSSLLQMSR